MRVLRTANMDGEGQKHAQTRDKEGSEDSEYRWDRIKAHTFWRQGHKGESGNSEMSGGGEKHAQARDEETKGV